MKNIIVSFGIILGGLLGLGLAYGLVWFTAYVILPMKGLTDASTSGHPIFFLLIFCAPFLATLGAVIGWKIARDGSSQALTTEVEKEIRADSFRARICQTILGLLIIASGLFSALIISNDPKKTARSSDLLDEGFVTFLSQFDVKFAIYVLLASATIFLLLKIRLAMQVAIGTLVFLMAKSLIYCIFDLNENFLICMIVEISFFAAILFLHSTQKRIRQRFERLAGPPEPSHDPLQRY